MKEIKDLVKNEAVFEGTENVKTDVLRGLKLELLALCKRTGDTGDYFIMKVKTPDKREVSFCNGSKVVMEKLSRAITEEITQDVLELKESIGMTIVEKKSKDGRVYMDLE